MNTVQTDRPDAPAPAASTSASAAPGAAASSAAASPSANANANANAAVGNAGNANVASLSGAGQAPQAAPAAGLRNTLLVAAVMLLPILVYFGTAASIVDIWERSGTFAHGYVILPISLWLVWGRRAELEALPIKPFWPGLVLLAGCGVAWLLADLVEVAIVRQYAFAAMLPLTVLTLLGTRIAHAITFPLVFILFGVPVGESLIPPLIDITANFTIDALRLTGIPVLRDGNSFAIPTGNWSVVEACSGLRYLISSITLGCLYAYLTYHSAWRRSLFILAAVIVPIIANGLRAYMIVMIGHLSGMTMAVGVDHLIYGWAFFGLVMLLLFWIGSFWREDSKDTPPAPTAAAAGVAGAVQGRGQGLPLPRLAAATLALALTLGMWPAYSRYLDNDGPAPAVDLARFQATAAPAAAFTDWQPAFPAANGQLRSFHATALQPVGLEVRFYRDQAGGAKLISSSNQLGWFDKGLHEVSNTVRTETIAGRTLQLGEAVLAEGVGGRRMLVWHWYWIDGKITTSNYVGKLLQVKQKLLAGSGDGAVVMVFSQYDENPDKARAALREFLNSNLAPLDATLAGTKRH